MGEFRSKDRCVFSRTENTNNGLREGKNRVQSILITFRRFLTVTETAIYTVMAGVHLNRRVLRVPFLIYGE